ncbi:MAG: lipopolysaccharide biosynthesis protein [Granulosicoccus sp.]|nr:lipopolysaccharide biosynthesis protein [Granulosicoccus sp.]
MTSDELIQPKQESQFVIWALLWTVITNFGGKFVNLLTTIVLAWILVKEDFGLAGYALVFVTFIEILEGFGVESALVYHDEEEDLLVNAFWISAFMGVFITLAVYFSAPVAAWIFDDDRAIPLVQALSATFFFTGLRIVPKALLSRRMQFKLLAIPELFKVIFKGVAAISLAIYGFGPWSLIWSVVIGMAVEMFVLWMLVDWRPVFRFVFKVEKIKPLLSYGSGLIGMSIVGTLIANIDYVFVGRLLGASALGVYMLGFRLPTLLISPIIQSLSKVLFPLSARKQTDHASLVQGWKYSIRYISILCVPLGVGMAAVSAAMVPALFGDKWIETIPVVAAIAIQNVLIAFAWHTGDIYKAIGRIKPLFWLNVIQLLITLPALYFAASVFGTVGAVAFAHVVAAALMVFVRLFDMSRVMSISLKEISWLLFHPILAGTVMAAVVVMVDRSLASLDYSVWIRLLVDIAVGGVVYLLMTWLTMREESQTAIEQLSESFGRRRGTQ